MSGVNLTYYNDQWMKTDPNVTTLFFQITAAKTVQSVPIGPPVLATFDALTQPQIDGFLGTTLEYTAAQFDATSMGTDAFAVLVSMQGQAAAAVAAEIELYSTTTAAGSQLRAACASSTITSSALAADIQYQRGINGDLAVKSVLTGVDVLTAGLIVLKLYWIAQ